MERTETIKKVKIENSISNQDALLAKQISDHIKKNNEIKFLNKNVSKLEYIKIEVQVESNIETIYIVVEPPTIRSVEIAIAPECAKFLDNFIFSGSTYRIRTEPNKYDSSIYNLQLKIPYIYHLLNFDSKNYTKINRESFYTPVYCHYNTFFSLEKCDLKNIKTFDKFFINPLTSFLNLFLNSRSNIIKFLCIHFYSTICLEEMRFSFTDFNTEVNNIPTFMKKIIDYYWFSTITYLLVFCNITNDFDMNQFNNPGYKLIKKKNNIPPYFNLFYWNYITRKYGHNADHKLFRNLSFTNFSEIFKLNPYRTSLIPYDYNPTDTYDSNYDNDDEEF